MVIDCLNLFMIRTLINYSSFSRHACRNGNAYMKILILNFKMHLLCCRYKCGEAET